MGKILGIVGGMGPLATVKLFEKIVLMTQARSDQEHLHVLIDNNSSIPDRTSYILNGGSNPKEKLIETAVRLQNAGADYLMMACNTAHYFYDDMVKNINIPFLHMIEETAKYVKKHYKGIESLGLLSTQGTINTRIYDNVFEKYNINLIKPTEENQRFITELIYNIKEGITQSDLTGFYNTLEEMRSRGAYTFILGCTELPVALDLYKLQGDYIDPLEIIAIKAIEFAGKKINKELL